MQKHNYWFFLEGSVSHEHFQRFHNRDPEIVSYLLSETVYIAKLSKSRVLKLLMMRLYKEVYNI